MDPLSALSIAAAVVQFVDFGSKLVSKGVQLYNSVDGVLVENADIERAMDRLSLLTGGLKTSLTPGPQSSISESDRLLQTICKSCLDISDELRTQLEKLKVPANTSHRKWKSFRKALKSVWSKESVDGLARKLESLKGELETHVLIGLRYVWFSLRIMSNVPKVS